jgi:Na+/alanine symporter
MNSKNVEGGTMHFLERGLQGALIIGAPASAISTLAMVGLYMADVSPSAEIYNYLTIAGQLSIPVGAAMGVIDGLFRGIHHVAQVREKRKKDFLMNHLNES